VARRTYGFGATYGPLTAVMALLLWANLTGIAIFGGLAFAAQLEARRVGVVRPALHDRWHPGDDDADPQGSPHPADSGVRDDPSG
jgi:uncharacterized BrkB/YihY/UPF0761 family membrane protein